MHRVAVPTSALLPAVLLSGCAPGGSEPPCVEGIDPGETFAAAVLEVYDETTTFAYDLPAHFGPDSDVPTLFESCIATDLVLGETLTVDVIGRSTDNNACNTHALSAHDTQLIEMGPTSGLYAGAIGSDRLGVAYQSEAVVNGCERVWRGYFLVREGANLTDPAVAGEVPPALLLRDLAPTPEGCPTSEPFNRCLYVIEISKL